MKKTLSAEEEFLKAFSSLIPTIIVEEFRAYYDENGKVLFFAANQFPDAGDWINITRELYETFDWQWLWVQDGKIIEQKQDSRHYFSLTPGNKGVKVVKYHANIVVEPHEDYEEVEYYDRRNS